MRNGKDAASGRYINTYMCDITRAIFPAKNDNLLKRVVDDGKVVEPEWFMPCVPLVLINASDGIATGYSSTLPQYSPNKLVKNILLQLDKKEPEPLHPWYNGFKGTICDAGNKKYVVYGGLERINKTTVRIFELPTGTSTESYELKVLNPLRGIEIENKKKKKGKGKTKKAATVKSKKKAAAAAASNKKKKATTTTASKKKASTTKAKASSSKKKKSNDGDDDDSDNDDDTKKKKKKKPDDILDVKKHNTDETVSFTVHMTKEGMAKAEKIGLYKYFKLIGSISTNNLVLFDAEGKIKKYNTVGEIEKEFFELCLKFYYKRKDKIIADVKERCNELKNKVKFILEVRDNQFNIKAEDNKLLKQLIDHEYTRYPKIKKAKVSGVEVDNDITMRDIEADNEEEEEEKENLDNEPKLSDYHYLIQMPILSLGQKLADKLQKEYDNKRVELKKLKETSPEDMWREDLQIFSKAYKQHKQDIIDNIEVARTRTEELTKLQEKKNKKRGLDDDNDSGKKKRKAIIKKVVEDIVTGTYIEPPVVIKLTGPPIAKVKKIKPTATKPKKTILKKPKEDDDDDDDNEEDIDMLLNDNMDTTVDNDTEMIDIEDTIMSSDDEEEAEEDTIIDNDNSDDDDENGSDEEDEFANYATTSDDENE